MNRKYILILLMIIAGCRNNNTEPIQKTDNFVIGKYINTNEPNVIHYVELKSDSTFIHYYKKNSEDAKINKGNWNLRKYSKKMKITFNIWKEFGVDDSDVSDSGIIWTVELIKGELVFNYDLPEERNFKKEELEIL